MFILKIRPVYVVYQTRLCCLSDQIMLLISQYQSPITIHPSNKKTFIYFIFKFIHSFIHSDLTLTQMLLNECRNQVKKGSLIGWIDCDWNWLIHNIT